MSANGKLHKEDRQPDKWDVGNEGIGWLVHKNADGYRRGQCGDGHNVQHKNQADHIEGNDRPSWDTDARLREQIYEREYARDDIPVESLEGHLRRDNPRSVQLEEE